MDNKRKRFKAHYKQRNDAFEQWCAGGYNNQDLPKNIPLPEDLKDLRCEAKTKATGQPCKIKAIYSNGRCKFHGGLSTGPRTVEGKKLSAQNGFKNGWRKRSP
ncbi:MAG: HGGxSTG domain-containing protein [Cycloclasticus sp.]|nr:HGGxSTG domain-containing protein [Cycloclasticus sp.]